MTEPVAVSYCVGFPAYRCFIHQVVADHAEVRLFFRAHGEGSHSVQNPRRSTLKQNDLEELPAAIELIVDELYTKQGMLRYPRRGDFGYFKYGVSGYTPVRISFGTPLSPELRDNSSSRNTSSQPPVGSSFAHRQSFPTADSLASRPVAAPIDGDNLVDRRSQDHNLPPRTQSIEADANRVLADALRGLAELNASIRLSDALLAVGSDDENRRSNNSAGTTQTRSIRDLRDQIFDITGAYPPRNLEEVDDFACQVRRSLGGGIDADADVPNAGDDVSEFFGHQDNDETSSRGPSGPEAWGNLPTEIRTAIFQTAASDIDAIAALRQHPGASAAPPENSLLQAEPFPTHDDTDRNEPAGPSLLRDEMQLLPPPSGSAQRNCIICFVRPMEMTFVHGATGHTACCTHCAAELVRHRSGRLCPVCRAPYSALIRNFSA